MNTHTITTRLTVLIASLLWLLPDTGSAQNVILCESHDDRFQYCPVRIRGDVSIERQLSRQDCRFRQNWGYDDDGIWVDNGCRAEFRVERRRYPDYESGWHPHTIRCESIDRRRSYCAIDTRGGVDIERQLSSANCIYRRTWGYDRRGIWVDQGCRADFRITSRNDYGGRQDDYHGDTVRCESIDGRHRYCRATTHNGVRMVRQLSNADCIRGRTWGYDRRGIWVDQGCRADFRTGW